MKMYYCYLNYTLPHHTMVEFARKTVLLAPTFSRAREMYIERERDWIEQVKDYKDFYIGIVEQKDGAFTFY